MKALINTVFVLYFMLYYFNFCQSYSKFVFWLKSHLYAIYSNNFTKIHKSIKFMIQYKEIDISRRLVNKVIVRSLKKIEMIPN